MSLPFWRALRDLFTNKGQQGHEIKTQNKPIKRYVCVQACGCAHGSSCMNRYPNAGYAHFCDFFCVKELAFFILFPQEHDGAYPYQDKKGGCFHCLPLSQYLNLRPTQHSATPTITEGSHEQHLHSRREYPAKIGEEESFAFEPVIKAFHDGFFFAAVASIIIRNDENQDS